MEQKISNKNFNEDKPTLVIPQNYTVQNFWAGLYQKVSSKVPCQHGSKCKFELECSYYHNQKELDEFQQTLISDKSTSTQEQTILLKNKVKQLEKKTSEVNSKQISTLEEKVAELQNQLLKFKEDATVGINYSNLNRFRHRQHQYPNNQK